MRYWTTGEVPADEDYVYVTRSCDEDVWRDVVDPGSGKIPVLYGSRQSGKSSLLVRLIDRAKNSHCTARVDVDAAFSHDSSGYKNELSILDALLVMIAEKAGCHDRYVTWNEQLSAQQALAADNVDEKFRRFVDEVLTAEEDKPILLVLDEFDRLRSFGPLWQFLLRCLDKHVGSAAAGRVRIVIAGLLRPTDLVANLDNSKWVQFRSHLIGDFDPSNEEVVITLARGLADVPTDVECNIVKTVLLESGGHPYLSVSLLERIAQTECLSPLGAEAAVAKYIDQNRGGPTIAGAQADTHFNFASTYLQASGELALPCLSTYERLLNADHSFEIEADVSNTLRGAGLIVVDGGVARVKSRVVREVFNSKWITLERSRILDQQAAHGETRLRGRSASPNLPKILILNTGGTLGMDFGQDDRVIQPATVDRFLNDVPELFSLADPIVERPFPPRDGANVAPPQWRLLADKINSYRDSQISGVVVITGTDTMAYSASAVAFALGKTLNFPVAFVGAQARRKMLFADSSPNLLRAVMVAAEGRRLPHVVIVFGDQVFRAVRADKKDDYRYDGFWAPTEGPLAVFVEDIKYQIDPELLRESHGDAGSEPRIDFEENILVISQRPGLRPELYLSLLESDRVKGVLIESLGVGNLPTSEDYSFESIIQCAIQRSVPVLIASRYPVQPELALFYQPATEFLKLAPQGVMSAGDMVPPAATVKFMWAIAEVRRRYAGRKIDDATRLRALEKLMSTNLVGEIRKQDAQPRQSYLKIQKENEDV